MSRLTKEREAEIDRIIDEHIWTSPEEVAANDLRQELRAVRAELASKKANCDGRCCEYHLPVEQERQRLATLCVEVQDENRSLRVELAEVHAQSVEASRLSTDLELQLHTELTEAQRRLRVFADEEAETVGKLRAERVEANAWLTQKHNDWLAAVDSGQDYAKALAEAKARVVELTEENRRLANLAMHSAGGDMSKPRLDMTAGEQRKAHYDAPYAAEHTSPQATCKRCIRVRRAEAKRRKKLGGK
jgi:hypothetical protein